MLVRFGNYQKSINFECCGGGFHDFTKPNFLRDSKGIPPSGSILNIFGEDSLNPIPNNSKSRIG